MHLETSMLSESDIQPRTTGEAKSPRKARIILIAGFLGSGKSTAITRLSNFLLKKGLQAAVLASGQGKELVDTATMRSRGLETEEIHGGCLAGDFDLFTGAARRVTGSGGADVLIAEAVGSCADLVATVSNPLRHFFSGEFTLAPLSVLVDPVRAERIFGLESGGKFSDKIAYIYRKQIEEAEIVVINKADLVSVAKLTRLKKVLEELAVNATVFIVSARTGEGLEDWFEDLVRREHSARAGTQVDYNVYAEAEAQLAWLHCTVHLSSVKYFDSSKVLGELAGGIQALLQQEGSEIGHLKVTLEPDEHLDGIAVLNLVRNDHLPELSAELPEPIQSGKMLLNLRAEADPEILHSIVNRALLALMEKSPDLFARMEHCEHFRPGRPQPTHRIASAV